VQATFDLSAYVGRVVWVRFRYCTDGGTSYAGWFVDDIEPSDLFMSETTVATNLTSAQYTFSNHPLGSYSYVVQSVDGEGDLAAWSAPHTLLVRQSSAVAAHQNPVRLARAWSWPGPIRFRPRRLCATLFPHQRRKAIRSG